MVGRWPSTYSSRPLRSACSRRFRTEGRKRKSRKVSMPSPKIRRNKANPLPESSSAIEPFALSGSAIGSFTGSAPLNAKSGLQRWVFEKGGARRTFTNSHKDCCVSASLRLPRKSPLLRKRNPSEENAAGGERRSRGESIQALGCRSPGSTDATSTTRSESGTQVTGPGVATNPPVQRP